MTAEREELEEATARECARLVCQHCCNGVPMETDSRGVAVHHFLHDRWIHSCHASAIWHRLAEQGIKP